MAARVLHHHTQLHASGTCSNRNLGRVAHLRDRFRTGGGNVPRSVHGAGDLAGRAVRAPRGHEGRAGATVLGSACNSALGVLAVARAANVSGALAWVSIAGGLFVCWLGYESLRIQSASRPLAHEQPRSLAKAIALNLLNPHVYLFWVTVGATGHPAPPPGGIGGVRGRVLCLPARFEARARGGCGRLPPVPLGTRPSRHDARPGGDARRTGRLAGRRRHSPTERLVPFDAETAPLRSRLLRKHFRW